MSRQLKAAEVAPVKQPDLASTGQVGLRSTTASSIGALGGGWPSVLDPRIAAPRPPWTVAAPQQAHLLAPASRGHAETGVTPGGWHRHRALSRLRQ